MDPLGKGGRRTRITEPLNHLDCSRFERTVVSTFHECEEWFKLAMRMGLYSIPARAQARGVTVCHGCHAVLLYFCNPATL
jgi:hypothetical protein